MCVSSLKDPSISEAISSHVNKVKPYLTNAKIANNFEVRGYCNNENPTKDHPLANLEVHCFELDDAGNPTYVRGTYGQRGYFEGKVIPGPQQTVDALVNFYEVGLVKGLTPDRGSAKISYSESTVVGKYWGNERIPGSFGDWGIVDSACDAAQSINESPDNDLLAVAFCFWPPTDVEFAEDLQDPSGRLFGGGGDLLGSADLLGSGDNENYNTLYLNALGSEFTGGNPIGAYVYYYSVADCKKGELDCRKGRNEEIGSYISNAVIGRGESAFVIPAVWNAATGPFANTEGSSLQAYLSIKDESGGRTRFIIEHFCNSKKDGAVNILGPCSILISPEKRGSGKKDGEYLVHSGFAEKQLRSLEDVEGFLVGLRDKVGGAPAPIPAVQKGNSAL